MHIRAFHLFISRLCASVELEISIGLRHCQVIVNKSYSNATPRVLPVTHRVSHSFFIPGRLWIALLYQLIMLHIVFQ